jgi:hypothetical protein
LFKYSIILNSAFWFASTSFYALMKSLSCDFTWASSTLSVSLNKSRKTHVLETILHKIRNVNKTLWLSIFVYVCVCVTLTSSLPRTLLLAELPALKETFFVFSQHVALWPMSDTNHCGKQPSSDTGANTSMYRHISFPHFNTGYILGNHMSHRKAASVSISSFDSCDRNLKYSSPDMLTPDLWCSAAECLTWSSTSLNSWCRCVHFKLKLLICGSSCTSNEYSIIWGAHNMLYMQCVNRYTCWISLQENMQNLSRYTSEPQHHIIIIS